MHDETLAQPILFRTSFKSSTSISILSAFVQWWVCGLSASGVRMDSSARAVLSFAVRNSVAVGSFPCPSTGISSFETTSPPPQKAIVSFFSPRGSFLFPSGFPFPCFWFRPGLLAGGQTCLGPQRVGESCLCACGCVLVPQQQQCTRKCISAMQQQPPLLPWISREKPDLHRLKMAIRIGQRPCLVS